MFHHVQSLDLAAGLSRSRQTEEIIAELSTGLMKLMRAHDLAVDFLAVSSEGLCIADASQNPTNAYKIRGALASAQAAQAAGSNLLVTASAGNHGAGIAFAGQLLNMQARVYVPGRAPGVKIQKIVGFGAEVVTVGSCFDECLAAARLDPDVMSGRGTFVHPFDNLMVAAGQGTIGIELFEEATRLVKASDYDVVRVYLPIGGGGLMAGVSSALKTRWTENLPALEIVGVIDESAPASLLATLFGRPVKVSPNTIADGTSVALVGQTFLSVSHLVDHLLLVPHDSIVSAMRRYETLTLTRLEGAGALALAGADTVQAYAMLGAGAKVLSFALVSGRNVDAITYQETVTATPRLNIHSHVRQGFDVLLPEQPGELVHFLRSVANYNIASLTYKQRPGATSGLLRVEFEVEASAVDPLESILMGAFPGSRRLQPGEHMVYEVGAPVAKRYHEELITLDDRPGSFLECIEKLSEPERFGSVGFLFYRKPPVAGTRAQLVVGRRSCEAV